MPVDDLYWNSIDFGSEESLHEPCSSKHYVDPWDLENYAYIREHLDPNESNSMKSGSEEFSADVNSNSFYYVPVQKEQNYADIEEVRRSDIIKDRKRYVYSDSGIPRTNRDNSFDSDIDENPYEENLKDISLAPSFQKTPTRDRSLSFSYGDYGYDPYKLHQQDFYCKMDEMQGKKDSTLPIYDDVRSNRRRKPRNFGLSNYGHLKIDYSYSWNNLNKYISN